jgi:metal-responsive CopG/Arc/MetJ family transcriptional regulator
MKKIERKIVISISLDPELLEVVNTTIANRSKFFENCIISELCKNLEIKEILKNKRILW